MGPVFYLVQCEEELLLITAVVLGNWPHEFALAPSPGKKGGRTAAGSVCAGCPRPRPAAGKKKLGAKFAPSGRCALLLCAARWWIFCEDRLGK
jgi:hypothetical protein